ncbi:MAG: hypothetical protein ACYTDT_08490 [Planctomycetota bacterium]|jgi:hypothetical protein
MKSLAATIAIGTFLLLMGCSSDGIVFNGVKQVQQFPVRKTPIVHYNLPSEVIDPVTGDASVDFATIQNLTTASFAELAAPGHDLWPIFQNSNGDCTDNPTCATPAPVPDWIYTLLSDLSPGGNWPHPLVAAQGQTAGLDFISAWSISFQNQWFFRDVDGAVLTPAVVGQAPVQYESVQFSSHAISLHEVVNMTVPKSGLAAPAQREAIDAAATPAVGANGELQINTPASNIVNFIYGGSGAPAGLTAAGMQEASGVNIHVEDAYGVVNSMPVPDYFGAGGTILAGGGVYHGDFMQQWLATTSGTASVISRDDGVIYSYYLGAISAHLVGYGVGLVDSSFALPGAVNDQESIMNLSIVLDLTAFIAAGKEMNFVVEDHLRMQDTVNGDFMAPGPLSTLPGTFR